MLDNGAVIERHQRQHRYRMPRGVGRQPRVGGQRHQAEIGRGDPARRGYSVRIAEYRQLLQMCQLAHVDLFGELTAGRDIEVLVVAQAAAGQRPGAHLRVKGALPQQHRQFGPLTGRTGANQLVGHPCRAATCADVFGEAPNLEHRGERFVDGVTMGHVFDYKSKTWFGCESAAM